MMIKAWFKMHTGCKPIPVGHPKRHTEREAQMNEIRQKGACCLDGPRGCPSLMVEWVASRANVPAYNAHLGIQEMSAEHPSKCYYGVWPPVLSLCIDSLCQHSRISLFQTLIHCILFIFNIQIGEYTYCRVFLKERSPEPIWNRLLNFKIWGQCPCYRADPRDASCIVYTEQTHGTQAALCRQLVGVEGWAFACHSCLKFLLSCSPRLWAATNINRNWGKWTQLSMTYWGLSKLQYLRKNSY